MLSSRNQLMLTGLGALLATVVLFAVALEHMFRRPVAGLLARRTTQPPI